MNESETSWHLSAISSIASMTSFINSNSLVSEISFRAVIDILRYLMSISRSIFCVSWASSTDLAESTFKLLIISFTRELGGSFMLLHLYVKKIRNLLEENESESN